MAEKRFRQGLARMVASSWDLMAINQKLEPYRDPSRPGWLTRPAGEILKPEEIKRLLELTVEPALRKFLGE
jgi:hypothetical protein